MSSKKGFVEIQFNWIFVLISGAIILILFAGIILDQKNISQVSTDVLIIKNLDAILSGSEVSTGTVNVFTIPNTKIEFECDVYSIGEVSGQFNMDVFAPSVLEGNSIISMTLGWNVPYKISNLVYLTNPNIRYVFVGNSEFSRNIFNLIPDEAKKDIYNEINEITNKNDGQVIIVFFDQNPEFPENLNNNPVTALKVTGNEDKGTLEFFNSENNKFVSRGTSYYLRGPTLLGAVFSDDLDNYDCVMENVFEKLNVVSQVYERRSGSLMLKYKDQQCEQYYDPGSIKTIKEASSTFSQSSINIIDADAKNLELQNKQAQLFSCHMIY